MKITRIVAGAVVTVMALGVSGVAHASYYPADRPTYTCTTPTNCTGADHVTFDSFTNNSVVGDERPFLAGSLNGANVQDRLKVKDGDVVTVRAYIHNNADASLMGGEDKTVAKNVKFSIIVPTASQTDTNLIGFISASNATPATINDTMSVYGDNAFTLEYVKGSAQWTHAADGVHQTTVQLGDSITSTGVSLGDINGCFAYSGYLTLQVKVHMPTTPPPVTPAYKCDLLHVLADNDTRKVTVDQFKTTATGGATFKNAVIDWGDKTNTNPLTTLVGQSHQYTADGTYKIVATANFNVGNEVKTDACSQTVTFSTTQPPVTPPVTPPTTPPAAQQLPNTGAGDVIGIFAGVVAAGTIGYRLFLSRKLVRR